LLLSLSLLNRLDQRRLYIPPLGISRGAAEKHKIHTKDLQTAGTGGKTLPDPLPIGPSTPSTPSPSAP
jgi:hypothetical protein